MINKLAIAYIILAIVCVVVPMNNAVVAAGGTDEAGLAFLAANKEKEGVITLPSGLQYKVLRSGSGVHHPKPSTSCSCHYEGKLIDGTVFDSSYERKSPTSFAPNQVIKGWTEAMQLMVEGDKWEMYIPSELGYGDRGSPPKIPGGSVLVFVMEIISISGGDEGKVLALKCDPRDKDLDNCNDREKTYIAKINEWADEKRAKEISRLGGLLEKPDNIKADAKEWINRRKSILNKMGGEDKVEQEL